MAKGGDAFQSSPLLLHLAVNTSEQILPRFSPAFDCIMICYYNALLHEKNMLACDFFHFQKPFHKFHGAQEGRQCHQAPSG